MSTPLDPDARTRWEVPSFTTVYWRGKQHPHCVVVPVINEGRRIESLLGRMAALGIDRIADVVIVDGGSTDGSLDPERLQIVIPTDFAMPADGLNIRN